MKLLSKTLDIGGKTLTLETGRFAEQANAAVLARIGDTMVLATVVASQSESNLDYFPLNVEYIERLYAGGRIKGSRWVKREGRPTDEAVLTARLVDRSIRPLFPEGYKNEVQVIITVLSVDSENDPDIPALYATSAALALSNIPWNGPIGAVRVGYVKKDGADGVCVANPTYQDLDFSDLDLVISTKGEAIVMMEGNGKQVPEEIVLKATEFGQQQTAIVEQFLTDFQKEAGKSKLAFTSPQIDAQLLADVEKEIKNDLVALIGQAVDKENISGSLNDIKSALFEKYGADKKDEVGRIVEKLFKKTIRHLILVDGKRPDGRKNTEVRPITIEVGVLPRTHGSAMFKRGQTQVLTVTTLGSASMEQLIENMEGEESKRYIHHYNFPPYSVGEVGRIGSPGRREIGHGALAERALLPVIPTPEQFPYTIQLVSEVMSSNGSTSMASTCGSTLSMMDAGVPIKAPIAGVAMGKISEGDKYVVLTDIIGLEDFNGDMDFKMAGSSTGVTAIQMDVKTINLTLAILKETVAQAREGRMFILDKINAAMPAARTNISKYAPKIQVVHVPVEKIGEVIGPGGKIIRKIIAETGATVEVEDDGSVSISAPDQESVTKAVAWVESLVKEVKAGEIYEGTVARIQPFGAFVEILPGKDGLVHVSRMSTEFVNDPNDFVKLGQKVQVRVTEIDDLGRINLSMVLDPNFVPPARQQSGPPRRDFGGPRRDFGGPRRDDRGPRR